jgi:proline iminopeptidase
MKQIVAVVVSLFALVLGGCAPQGQQEARSGSENEGRAGVVAVEGARLHYKIEGSGIPLVLIGNTRLYPPVFSQELREHFQMIFVDTRLVVPTEDGFDVGSITLETLAEDVEALRRELALEKIAVLGHSVHGLIALEYGRRFPQHTTHVIMLATPSRSLLAFSDGGSDFIPEVKEYFDRDTSEERKAIFKRNLEGLPEKLSQAPPEKQFGVWYAAHAPYFFYDPNYDPAWLFEESENNPAVFRQVFESALNGYDAGQALDETQAPIFLAVGRRDYGAPPYMWEEYRDKPNFSFNLFEKSGHYPMMEEQELFDQKLIEWAKAQQK